MKINFVLIILIIFLAGCKHYCDDLSAHLFTEAELEWFSFADRDTMFFIDVNTDSIFFLACTRETVKIDSEFFEDGNCRHDGYYLINHAVRSYFDQNFPYFKEYGLVFEILTYTKGYYSLNSDIIFYRSTDYPWIAYGYHIEFDNRTEDIVELTPGGSTQIYHIDEMYLQNIRYKNISKIYCESCNESVFYDTIYFNNQGFLKFSSSQYGYELERIE